MKTVRGIYYDLSESEYVYNYSFNKNFKFYFSSSFLMNKFQDELENYIKYETARLRQRYHVYVDMMDLLCIALYLKIEKRGFYVEYKDKILDKQDIKFYIELLD